MNLQPKEHTHIKKQLFTNNEREEQSAWHKRYKSSLKNIDQFGTSINFSWNQDSGYRTKTGGIFTVLVLSMAFYVVYTYFMDFLFCKEPNVIFTKQSQVYDEDNYQDLNASVIPRFIPILYEFSVELSKMVSRVLTLEEFNCQFDLNINQQSVSISVAQYDWGTFKLKKNCKSANVDADVQNYKSYKNEDTLCIDTEQFKLYGDYLNCPDKKCSYFQLELYERYDQSECTVKMDHTNYFGFGILNMNSEPNPKNYKNPWNQNEQLFFYYIDRAFSKILYLAYSKIVLKTVAHGFGLFSGISDSSQERAKEIWQRTDNAKRVEEIPDIAYNQPLLSIYFLPSNTQDVVNRAYPTLIDIFSRIGGSIEFLMVIAGLFIVNYVQKAKELAIIRDALMITGKYGFKADEVPFAKDAYPEIYYKQNKKNVLQHNIKLLKNCCCRKSKKTFVRCDSNKITGKNCTKIIDENIKTEKNLLDETFKSMLERHLDLRSYFQMCQDFELIRRILFKERHQVLSPLVMLEVEKFAVIAADESHRQRNKDKRKSNVRLSNKHVSNLKEFKIRNMDSIPYSKDGDLVLNSKDEDPNPEFKDEDPNPGSKDELSPGREIVNPFKNLILAQNDRKQLPLILKDIELSSNNDNNITSEMKEEKVKENIPTVNIETPRSDIKNPYTTNIFSSLKNSLKANFITSQKINLSDNRIQEPKNDWNNEEKNFNETSDSKKPKKKNASKIKEIGLEIKKMNTGLTEKDNLTAETGSKKPSFSQENNESLEIDSINGLRNELLIEKQSRILLENKFEHFEKFMNTISSKKFEETKNSLVQKSQKVEIDLLKNKIENLEKIVEEHKKNTECNKKLTDVEQFVGQMLDNIIEFESNVNKNIVRFNNVINESGNKLNSKPNENNMKNSQTHFNNEKMHDKEEYTSLRYKELERKKFPSGQKFTDQITCSQIELFTKNNSEKCPFESNLDNLFIQYLPKKFIETQLKEEFNTQPFLKDFMGKFLAQLDTLKGADLSKSNSNNYETKDTKIEVLNKEKSISNIEGFGINEYVVDDENTVRDNIIYKNKNWNFKQEQTKFKR